VESNEQVVRPLAHGNGHGGQYNTELNGRDNADLLHQRRRGDKAQHDEIPNRRHVETDGIKGGKKQVKTITIFLLNATWGFIQTLVGFIGFLIYIGKPHYIYKGSIITVVKGNWGGISLGSFIFIDADIAKADAPKSKFINHEYGHTLQSILLGPLYLLIIGLPSIVWAGLFDDWRIKHKKSYYWLYTESWADKLGGVER